MEFENVFEGNTMWENNIPSPKMKAWKKITQRTKKMAFFGQFPSPCPPWFVSCALGTWHLHEGEIPCPGAWF